MSGQTKTDRSVFLTGSSKNKGETIKAGRLIMRKYSVIIVEVAFVLTSASCWQGPWFRRRRRRGSRRRVPAGKHAAENTGGDNNVIYAEGNIAITRSYDLVIADGW